MMYSVTIYRCMKNVEYDWDAKSTDLKGKNESKTTWTFDALLHKYIGILNIKLSLHIETNI
jgi:hypothetical protein